MFYAEAAYFDGNACQHVADWQDALRLRRIRAETERAARGSRRTSRYDPTRYG